MLEGLILALFLVPASVAALYYFSLTTVGWVSRRDARSPDTAAVRFAVVIPAHNEELGLPATLRSVAASDYPAECVRVLVVADNCADGTAAVARRLGAECLERVDPVNHGKGYALAAAIPYALESPSSPSPLWGRSAEGRMGGELPARDARGVSRGELTPHPNPPPQGGREPERCRPDAVMVLDADCELAPDVLWRVAADIAAGAEAVQAARVPRNPGDGPAALVSAVGSAIENAVSAGRSRLGRTVALRGSGMAFTRSLLERFPWSSYGLTEDAEYAGELARAGVRVRFLPDAVVTGEVPADVRTLATQRRRWRAALWGGGPGPFARWVASKPLVLLHLAATAAVAGGLSPWLPAWAPVWAAVLVGLTAVVYLRAVRRAGAGGWSQVARAGGVAARLAGVTLAGFADRGRAWERTRRIGEVKQSV